MFTMNRNGRLGGDSDALIARLGQLTDDLRALAGGEPPGRGVRDHGRPS